MRIEKINDHQIRCTLNQRDLIDRELRISELAYGSEKAKSLFRDMMQQAAYEFGFEVDDIPIMIEAIPMYPDTLVLLITKVDDPDELDTRFSHFTDDDSDLDFDELDDETIYAFDTDFPDDELLNQDMDHTMPDNLMTIDREAGEGSGPKETEFISLSEALGMERRPKTKDFTASHDVIKIFSFSRLQELSDLAEYLMYTYTGENTIYKDEKKGQYYLVAHKSEHTPEEFNTICNMILEYGYPVRNMYASHSYYEEHFEPLIREHALQRLASI